MELGAVVVAVRAEAAGTSRARVDKRTRPRLLLLTAAVATELNLLLGPAQWRMTTELSLEATTLRDSLFGRRAL